MQLPRLSRDHASSRLSKSVCSRLLRVASLDKGPALVRTISTSVHILPELTGTDLVQQLPCPHAVCPRFPFSSSFKKQRVCPGQALSCLVSFSQPVTEHQDVGPQAHLQVLLRCRGEGKDLNSLSFAPCPAAGLDQVKCC